VLVGLAGWTPRAVGLLKPAERIVSVPVVDSVPAVGAANKEERAALAHIDVAERERWPTPTLGVGALVTTDAYSLSAYAGLSLDLPLFDRGQGPIARANAEARVAARQREAVIAEVTTELDRAKRLLEARQRALETFERDVVIRLPTLRQMAEDAYRSGQGTILDLLDTLRTLTDTRLIELDYIESEMLAEVNLLAASGRIDVEAR
jgi:cobalt-zinc-cadmium efflux system outer membrane protein